MFLRNLTVILLNLLFIFSYFSYSFFYCSNTPWVKTVDVIWHKRLKMDLKIGSINVRGLGDQVKRREIFNWLPERNIQYILFKKCTVQKTIKMIGGPNGAIKFCSAAAPVKRQVLSHFLTITSPFKFLKQFRSWGTFYTMCSDCKREAINADKHLRSKERWVKFLHLGF